MLLQHMVDQALKTQPGCAGLSNVIEKEILHHDVFRIMMEEGVLQDMTFIGGTSLRLCYNSSRLSEDIDFNAGFEFKAADFNGLDSVIAKSLTRKYDLPVSVKVPAQDKTGDTRSWKISIVKEATRKDLPIQKLHIDVCAIPSFDVSHRPLINHHQLNLPTTGMLVPVQSMKEALADKLIALAYRSRRIKPRDVWDITWLAQQGVSVSNDLVELKLEAREKTQDNFESALSEQLYKLNSDTEVEVDFAQEMERFLPQALLDDTLKNPDFWPYVKEEVSDMGKKALSPDTGKRSFNMSP